ncbi:DUF1987 domain-containing protein [Bacteroidota bacterium]
MDIIVLKQSNSSPKVTLDKDKGIFEIIGMSFPEDVKEFYFPLINWFKLYFEDPNEETLLRLRLLYMNTASSKMIYEIFQLFRLAHKAGIKVKIHWQYNKDDEQMGDAGEDFAFHLEGVPFHVEGVEIN